MVRILVGSVPAAGHVNPLLPIVRALCARGHEIRWYAGRKYQSRVEATGARFVPITTARDYDDAALERDFPGRARLSGLAQLKFDMKHVFIDQGAGQAVDLERIAKDFTPDVLLCEAGTLGGLLHSERSGIPLVVLGVIPLARSSIDTAPFGLGLAHSTTIGGHLRNRVLNWTVEHVLFRDVQAHWNATRRSLGLPETGWWLNAGERATVYLQPTVPSLEYPRRDLQGNHRYIGLIPAEVPANSVRPSFWDELDGRKPIIHVTQGTLANTSPQLFAPALAGLADEDVLVVVATGARDPASLGLSDVPRNARIATFLSYPDLLPKLAAMVTNGGYGGVQMALAHGVPLVVAGMSEDKPEVAMRVAHAGAGVNLRTSAPTPQQVRDAVRAVLRDSRYRQRAQALAEEYARYDAIALAVEVIERTAGDGVSSRPR